MKEIYKLIAKTTLTVYMGLVAGNGMLHGYEAWNAQKESQKPYYGEKLSKQWEDYSASHLERLTDARLLIPLSSIGSVDRPVQISIDSELEGIIKIDVVKK